MLTIPLKTQGHLTKILPGAGGRASARPKHQLIPNANIFQ